MPYDIYEDLVWRLFLNTY